MRFLKKKSEDGELLRAMILQLQNLFNDRTHTICIIRSSRGKWILSDGGGEYIGSEFCSWLNKKRHHTLNNYGVLPGVKLESR